MMVYRSATYNALFFLQKKNCHVERVDQVVQVDLVDQADLIELVDQGDLVDLVD